MYLSVIIYIFGVVIIKIGVMEDYLKVDLVLALVMLLPIILGVFNIIQLKKLKKYTNIVHHQTKINLHFISEIGDAAVRSFEDIKPKYKKGECFDIIVKDALPNYGFYEEHLYEAEILHSYKKFPYVHYTITYDNRTEVLTECMLELRIKKAKERIKNK